jgi:hypothetical protein
MNIVTNWFSLISLFLNVNKVSLPQIIFISDSLILQIKNIKEFIVKKEVRDLDN